MKPVKIGIIGTRGIPNVYGGFEQFAEYFSVGMTQKGYRITVYSSSSHPYRKADWKDVKIKHIWDPEERIGTIGQFLYDLGSILHCRNQGYDVIIQLGYTSSSIWGWLLPKRAIVITNMDGLEWKRSKFSGTVQRFLKFAESLAIRWSDHWVADSVGIKQYLFNQYGKQSVYIPYGASLVNTFDISLLVDYRLEKYGYNMLIARLEPENNIEMILDGVVEDKSFCFDFLVVGKYESRYGSYLRKKYINYERIRFLGGIYDIDKLNSLRAFSNIYFHGHSVGGTNPSLLEAMASNALICAHDNIFNKSILNDDAFYFKSVSDVVGVLSSVKKDGENEFVRNNRLKIEKEFSWNSIIERYEKLILDVLA